MIHDKAIETGKGWAKLYGTKLEGISPLSDFLPKGELLKDDGLHIIYDSNYEHKRTSTELYIVLADKALPSAYSIKAQEALKSTLLISKLNHSDQARIKQVARWCEANQKRIKPKMLFNSLNEASQHAQTIGAKHIKKYGNQWGAVLTQTA